MASTRFRYSTLLLVLLPLFSCDCGDDLGNLAPAGLIEPGYFDFGPVSAGTECQAELQVVNNGQSDFSVTKSEVANSSGDFSILIPPKEIALGRSEKMLIKYVASSAIGSRETGVIQLTTDIPGDNGVLNATVTGIPSEGPAALATAGCALRGEDTLHIPCTDVDYGAVTVDDAGAAIEDRLGLTLEIVVINEGTQELGIDLVTIDQGSTEFGIMGYEYNGSIVDISGEEAFKIPAGRSGDCGALADDGSNHLTIKVKYSPVDLGADADTLKILTDAVEGNELAIPLTGYGAKQGLLFTPEFLNLNAGEGATQDEEIVVSNMGSAEARVNTSCIDLDGDESCDGDCTGGDPVLGGALSCDVLSAGKGFILAATDGTPGGDDEVTVQVTWAPSAGNTTIPAGSVIRFESNILGDRVYEISLLGGVSGNLAYETNDACEGFDGVCVLATGTEEDTTTWTGSASFTVTNTGDATVTMNGYAWSTDTPETTSDDFQVLDGTDDLVSSGTSISVAPGNSKTLNVTYTNNDFSTEDLGNLIITHSGQNETLTIPIGAYYEAE